jgi:GWxTD domain-containing protein
MTSRIVMVLLPGVLFAARPAGAQAPAERATLDALRRELAGITDSTALLAREAAGMVQARQYRDSTLLHLQLGFIAYRLGEVTGERRHYDEAAGEFEWAAELRPDWPYPWYGLGLSELALGEHPAIAIENVRQVLGKDFLSKAASAFARAAAADPGFAQPVIDLAEAARRQRVRQRLDVAQRALRAAAATGAGSMPALQLARGRVEREMGEGDSALAAFGAYLDVGGDRGVGLLERARTLFYLRRPDEAHRAYFDGARAPMSGEARVEYRADLVWILTPDERSAFDTEPDTALHGWLERFWTARDAGEVRAAGERLAEHYRRCFYAWRHFRLVSRHRRYTTEPYRSDQELLDDRGVIYIRHGEPDDRARYVGQGDPAQDLTIEPNESWLYRWPSGDRIFHFVARDDVQDYKLIESLADIFGDRSIGWQAAGALPPLVREVYDSRASLDPEYRRLALTATAQGTALANERRAGREAVRVGTTTDSYPLRFDGPLQSRIQLYAVGGVDGGARALLVFAVPGAGLSGRAVAGGMEYPLDVRVGGGAVYLDTVRVFRSAARLEPDQLLSGLLVFPLPPGTHALHVALLEPGGRAGDVVSIRDFEVPDFAAGGLVLSDLVLGDRTSGLHWNVLGDTVPLSPRGAYGEGGSVELYYELHGLPAGAPYRARIEVRGRRGGSIFARIGRLFGGGPPVAFSFDGVTSGVPHRAMQTVGLAPLEPGDYVLSLRVEDVEREVRQVREVPLRVVAR